MSHVDLQILKHKLFAVHFFFNANGYDYERYLSFKRIPKAFKIHRVLRSCVFWFLEKSARPRFSTSWIKVYNAKKYPLRGLFTGIYYTNAEIFIMRMSGIRTSGTRMTWGPGAFNWVWLLEIYLSEMIGVLKYQSIQLIFRYHNTLWKLH